MDAERALRRLRDAYGAGEVSTATLEVRTALALTGRVEDAVWDLPRWRLTRDPVRALVMDGSEWPLTASGRRTLGRASDCDIHLAADDAVSRHHAEIAVRAGICLIRDLGSTAKRCFQPPCSAPTKSAACARAWKGTLLNGRFVTRARLRRGDVLELGVTEIDIR